MPCTCDQRQPSHVRPCLYTIFGTYPRLPFLKRSINYPVSGPHLSVRGTGRIDTRAALPGFYKNSRDPNLGLQDLGNKHIYSMSHCPISITELFILLSFIFLKVYVYGYFASMCVHHVHTVPMRARRGCENLLKLELQMVESHSIA